MVMSVYALLKTNPTPSRTDIENSLDGNLCRCTGYRPILQSVDTFSQEFTCGLGDKCCKARGGDVPVTKMEAKGGRDYQPYDPSQDPIFPNQLQMCDDLDQQSLRFPGASTTWLRPTTLEEFLKLQSASPNAIIMGGFTCTGLQEKPCAGAGRVLLSVSGLKEAHLVDLSTSCLTVGAALTITDTIQALQQALARHTNFSSRGFAAVESLLRCFGSTQLRNMATLGGSLQANHPRSDVTTALLGAGASIKYATSSGQIKAVPLVNLCPSGTYQPLATGSVLLAVSIPFTQQNQHMFAYKQASRSAMDRAIVNSGLSVTVEEETGRVQAATLCFGGVGPAVMLAEKTARHMLGQTWDEHLLESVLMKLNEELAVLDVDNKKCYRLSLALGFIFKFYEAVNRQRKGAPADRPGFSVDACHSATQIWEEIPPEQPLSDAIGRPQPKVDASKMATGEAMFYSDLPQRTDELVLVLVRSTRAHAQIVSVDTSVALRMPGVVGCVGHEDVPGSNECGEFIKDELVFAVDKVNNVGQTICGVVAETQHQAALAAKAVMVTYNDVKPVIITIEEAIKAKSFYPESRHEQKRGDTEKGFTEAEQVLEGTVRMGGQEHFYMETQFVCVVPVGREDEYNVYMSAQNISFAQESFATILNIPRNKVVVHLKRIGGSFGGKESRPIITLVLNPAAVAAYKFQRPIRHHLTREEDFTTTGGRHPYIVNYKVGFGADGRIKALEYEFFGNGGSDSDLSTLVGMSSVLASESAYRIPAVCSKVVMCRTNTVSPTAFRGFGRPQAYFATEVVMDHIAQTLGVLPELVRDRNLLCEGDVLLLGRPVDAGLRRCWNELQLKCDIAAKRENQKTYNKNNRYKKIGIAVIPTIFGIGLPIPSLCQGTAYLLVYLDGSVLLAHGGIEVGQGLNTKMIQIASHELGIPADRIHITEASTSTVPNATVTGGSTGTDVNGPAVMDACRKLKQRLEPVIKSDPKGSWDEWVQAAYQARISLSVSGFDTCSDEEAGDWKGCQYYTQGVACSEVQVDCLTGHHVILQTDIVMDVGRSLNPGIDVGQIEGAFVTGSGLFTIEEVLCSRDGTVISKNPDSYKIPTVKDTPRVFNVTLLKGSDTPRPVYSSRGIGEPPLALGMSVYYAIKDAVTSARQDAGLTGFYSLDSPATGERIRMACTDKITRLVTGSKDYVQPDWRA